VPAAPELQDPAVEASWKNPRLAGQIPELDGIRGLAIALVLAHHLFAQTIRAAPGTVAADLVTAMSLSWSGVDLFFVLSGFLIGGILLDAKESKNYFRTFYARRVGRIFPAYYCILGVLIVLAGIGAFPYRAPRVIPVWSYLTYTQNFPMAIFRIFEPEWIGATWSLAVEEQFYLILPLVILLLSRRSLAVSIAACVAMAPAFREYLHLHGAHFLAIYTLLPCRMDSLLLGVLVASAARNERLWALFGKYKLVFVLALVLLGCALAELSLQNRDNTIMSGVGYSLIALFYACLLATVIWFPDSLFGRLSRLRPLRHLGGIAYGVYLVHPAINLLAHGFFLHALPVIDGVKSLGVTLLGLALSIGVALLSWEHFERPIVNSVRRHFSY
jgi:peptidoglycan/LPS O-acetylase OafA/YrhL